MLILKPIDNVLRAIRCSEELLILRELVRLQLRTSLFVNRELRLKLILVYCFGMYLSILNDYFSYYLKL